MKNIQRHRAQNPKLFISIICLASLFFLSSTTHMGCSSSSGGGGLFGSEAPYADMMNVLGTTDSITIRGRIVQEDQGYNPVPTDPLSSASQDEIKGASVSVSLVGNGQTITLGSSTADAEGYVVATFPVSGASAGEYQIQVTLDGAAADGVGHARLTSPDYSGILVRSDIDLTYLNTNFTSKVGLLELMEQSASERESLPAMEVVYQALREGAGGADRPLTFVSGSPTFFKRVLESKAALDSVHEDGIFLKNYTDLTSTNLAEFDVFSIVPDLKEQVGYKLAVFLEIRLEMPASAPEVYLGDDSEADFVVYNLYHRFTAGELDVNALLAELDALEVVPVWRDLIAELAPKVAAHLAGASAPVRAIYINRTGKTNERFTVSDWLIADMSRLHTGAWPLILDLYEEGLVTDAAVGRVRDRLKALGQGDDVINQAAQDGVDDGFLDQGTVVQFTPIN